MCSGNPEKWLPGALIEAVHYRGIKQDSNYQNYARTITGPRRNKDRKNRADNPACDRDKQTICPGCSLFYFASFRAAANCSIWSSFIFETLALIPATFLTIAFSKKFIRSKSNSPPKRPVTIAWSRNSAG